MGNARNLITIMESISLKAYNDISAKWTTANGSALSHNFFPGTPLEIKRRITTLNKDRFPAICMVYNFKQTSGSRSLYNSSDISFWLMHLIDKNKPNYEDQYTEMIEVYLYPYWDALRNRIRKSGYVQTDISKGVEFEITERPNWGNYIAGVGNTANELGEQLAGLEVLLKLQFTDSNCFAVNKKDRVI